MIRERIAAKIYFQLSNPIKFYIIIKSNSNRTNKRYTTCTVERGRITVCCQFSELNENRNVFSLNVVVKRTFRSSLGWANLFQAGEAATEKVLSESCGVCGAN